MLHRQRSWLGLWVLLALTTAAPLWAQNENPAALWADFNHYVLIARPDLAQAAGSALLGKVDDAKLLDIVEESVKQGDYANYHQTLDRAMKIDSLKDIANQIETRLQKAQIARARESNRIEADIKKLTEGARPNFNAIERLRAAGQYAAPALLAVLLDDTKADLHPYVLEAMISIGRPLVTPLSEALPGLEPVPQGQVAQVLARIGYPRALPELKQVIENPKTDPNALKIVQNAYDQLARNINLDPNISAAMLYLRLAQNFYASATRDIKTVPDLDAATMTGLVWSYTPNTGLQYTSVPAEIFGDVEAMTASMQALRLNHNLDAALSTWLMANLRRANRLPEGKPDPTYPATMLPPIFYARASGPLRLHDVLAEALVDSDSKLALDAIGALSATAGTDALVNRRGTGQPLVQALYYPDRRVRYEAAFTFTNARPRRPFMGSDHVVPVLAEAVRQSDKRYAVVVGSDQDSSNKLKDILTHLNYQAFGGASLRQAFEAVGNEPGVDLIVTNLDIDHLQTLIQQASADYKLAATPILVLTSTGDQIALNARYGATGRVRSAIWTTDSAALSSAVEQAVQSYAGKAIDAKEALGYTTKALNLLSTVAVGAGDVFNVADAQPALVQALADPRPGIPVLAAQVLNKINSPEAQQAIADAALDTTRPEPVRIALLDTLSESATNFGNHLNSSEIDQVQKLVTGSSGDLAVAAARLHGALTLPTADVVQMILK